MQQQEQQNTWDAWPDQDAYPEDEIETVHLYVVPEHRQSAARKTRHHKKKRTLAHLLVQWLALFLLTGFTIGPRNPSSVTKIINVPAILLPPRIIEASAAIVATGTQIIPATQAHGTLTIYNGTELVQQLPAGFLVTSRGGVEVATEQVVAIPAAHLPALGIATVAAHAVQPGTTGNLAAAAIRQEDGSSLVITNTTAFTGGQDAQTETVVTAADQTRALTQARGQARANVPLGLQAKPCSEVDAQNSTQVMVTLTCQLVTYNVPLNAQVLAVVSVTMTRVLVEVRLPIPER